MLGAGQPGLKEFPDMAVFAIESEGKGNRSLKLKRKLLSFLTNSRFGLSFNLGKWDLFVGFHLQEVIYPPKKIKSKRVIKSGKATWFPLPE
jgi:hypothetical protein